MLQTSKPLPLDIKPAWLNVIRRMQSVARQSYGSQAIITNRGLVDPDGNPLNWTAPQVVAIEPRSCSILDVMAGNE